MSWKWIGMGVAGLAACAQSPSDSSASRSVYLSVVSQRKIQPDEGLRRCAAIVDPQLAGDCALYVVSLEARRREGRPAQWCEQVPEGPWQSECWFVAAESSKRARKFAEASVYCSEAGPFRNDCAQHLWQSEVHGLIHSRGPQGFATQLPEAESIHDRWAELLADSSDFESRYWAKFYQNGFEGRGSMVDLAHCEVLAMPHRERCLNAATELYGRELAPRLSEAGMSVCTVSDPGDGRWSAHLADQVPAQPHPRLDAVIAERRASCP